MEKRRRPRHLYLFMKSCLGPLGIYSAFVTTKYFPPMHSCRSLANRESIGDTSLTAKMTSVAAGKLCALSHSVCLVSRKEPPVENTRIEVTGTHTRSAGFYIVCDYSH